MGDRDENVVSLRVSLDASPEEKRHRIMAEATRLANLAPGEWTIWYKGKAEEFGIEPNILAGLVQAQIKDREQKAAEKLKQDRLQEVRAERLRKTDVQEFREKARAEDAAAKAARTKSKAFADITELPADQHDGKLDELAKLLGEDVEALKAEFADYYSAEIADTCSTPSSDWDDEAWPEAISAAQLLEELVVCINKHIVAKPHEVLIIALWVLMAWIHEAVAHYSPYLVLTSAIPGCGKTTCLELVGRLTPRPYSCGAATAAIFRVIDRDKPTLLGDNVDTLFQRRPDLTELFLLAHTRGWKIPRTEKTGGEWITRWFDPFCPKAVTLVGTNLPEALSGRSIVIELWKMKSGETVVKVDLFNQELIDTFKTLRRKMRRWADDNAPTLKAAKPTMPSAFINRPADLWILLLAIADAAGSDWSQLARDAAERLSQEGVVEPSWLERLVQEAWVLFVEPREGEKRLVRIPSEDLVERLTADRTSVWCDYGRGHDITVREVAALWRKLHIHPRAIGIGKKRLKGYYAEDLFKKQVFERLLGRDPKAFLENAISVKSPGRNPLLRSQPTTTVRPSKQTMKPKRAKRKAR